uniref:Uncharacterized protein n=1 Tax=Strigamia maritima TaxID=126957 RepID=T1IKZ9_STRMM
MLKYFLTQTLASTILLIPTITTTSIISIKFQEASSAGLRLSLHSSASFGARELRLAPLEAHGRDASNCICFVNLGLTVAELLTVFAVGRHFELEKGCSLFHINSRPVDA